MINKRRSGQPVKYGINVYAGDTPERGVIIRFWKNAILIAKYDKATRKKTLAFSWYDPANVDFAVRTGKTLERLEEDKLDYSAPVDFEVDPKYETERNINTIGKICYEFQYRYYDDDDSEEDYILKHYTDKD